MRLVLATPQVAIYDDVLAAEQADALWRSLEVMEFRHAHSDRVNGVWRVEDGAPMTSATFMVDAPNGPGFPDGLRTAARASALFYPSGTALDPALAGCQRAALAHPELLGEPGSAWLGTTAQVHVYPQGGALSWHRDSLLYAGAFVLYAHREWNAQWGGELLVADERTRPFPSGASQRKHVFDNRLESQILLEAGMGHYIAPKPNRLVLLAAGVPHAVAPVSRAAGHRVRASVAGFFVNRAWMGEFARLERAQLAHGGQP